MPHVATFIRPERLKELQRERVTAGVVATYGLTREGKRRVQALSFDDAAFTRERAEAWLAMRDKKYVELQSFNEEHDERGRFASKGAGSASSQDVESLKRAAYDKHKVQFTDVNEANAGEYAEIGEQLDALSEMGFENKRLLNVTVTDKDATFEGALVKAQYDESTRTIEVNSRFSDSFTHEYMHHQYVTNTDPEAREQWESAVRETQSYSNFKAEGGTYASDSKEMFARMGEQYVRSASIGKKQLVSRGSFDKARDFRAADFKKLLPLWRGSFRSGPKESANMRRNVQSFVSISTSIQALYGIDILSLVPMEVLNGIRARDPHPFLQAYSICHEGVSTPTLLGDVARPIRWTRRAVQSIKGALLRGLKFFSGHNADNSTENREVLGEVVWDGQREIDGALHHVVVGYFPDKERVIDKDICSQEGEWNFVEEAGRWFADKLHRMTGIALSSSVRDKPAFDGARRLAMIQALDEDEEAPKGRKREERRVSKLDLSTASFDDIVTELKARKTFPHQLFTVEEVQADVAFKPVFDESARLKATVAERDATIKKLTDEKTVSDGALRASTARGRYDAFVGAMKLTPRQKTFLQKAYPSKIADASDEALKAFIATKLEDFKSVALALDVKEELPGQGSAEEEGQEREEVQKDDLTKAKNNPLLEEDMVSV